jgi:hypothetical protein
MYGFLFAMSGVRLIKYANKLQISCILHATMKHFGSTSYCFLFIPFLGHNLYYI